MSCVYCVSSYVACVHCVAYAACVALDGYVTLQKCISHLPDKILLEVFSYLRLSDVCRLASVCKAWRLLAYDGRLWTRVSLRPDFNGLHVHNIEALVALISARFGATLRYIELSGDLITPAVLHELANRCVQISVSLCPVQTCNFLPATSCMSGQNEQLVDATSCLFEQQKVAPGDKLRNVEHVQL